MTGINEIAAFGFTVALVVYALLAILSLGGWQRTDQSRLPAVATGISVVWAAVWIAGFLDFTRAHALVTFVEWSRGLAWLGATIAIVREITDIAPARRVRSGYAFLVFLLVALPVGYFLFESDAQLPVVLWITGGYTLSVLIVLAAEQLYRNSPIDTRSEVAYLCIAIAGVFVFDLMMYGQIIAGIAMGAEYWAARGFVNALLAVPLVLGVWRRSYRSSAARAPREIAFYSFGMSIIAIYVVLIFIGNQYIQRYEGSWSDVGSIVLIVAATGAAAVVLASARVRARVRVILTKTFLQYKYDYRKEWLRFISTLSKSGLEDVPTAAVRAVAQIVNSPGGVVWTKEQDSEGYLPAGAWRCSVPDMPLIAKDSGIVQFMIARHWVVNLEEIERHPELYEGLALERWLRRENNWWLVVPLFLGNRLYGFILLQEPRVAPKLNFEDHDLLRTAGSHVAMHINQAESDKRLAESRQFGAYNRLTAFLMHDLNNLLAQQSLVVENAERFRDNPKFVDDAFDTIAHSVSRMKRLMKQLSSGSKVPRKEPTDIQEAVTNAVERCQTGAPKPTMRFGDAVMRVRADMEPLTTVFEHLIRNAQEATNSDGEIEIAADSSGSFVIVSIRDTGKGMSPEFVRQRLFRPFDSTKGSQNMGIGAYQARDYVRSLGGQMEVLSVPGAGTTFTIRLPAIG